MKPRHYGYVGIWLLCHTFMGSKHPQCIDYTAVHDEDDDEIAYFTVR